MKEISKNKEKEKARTMEVKEQINIKMKIKKRTEGEARNEGRRIWREQGGRGIAIKVARKCSYEDTYHDNGETTQTDAACCNEEQPKQYWVQRVFHCLHETEI
jgi:hypothetical protein